MPVTIQKLESTGLSLDQSIGIYVSSVNQLQNVPGDCGKKIKKKIRATLEKKAGLKELRNIVRILCGEFVQEPIQTPQHSISQFKYAPITSCDVERPFLTYKLILTDKYHQLTPSNLEKMIVIYCNSDYNTPA